MNYIEGKVKKIIFDSHNGFIVGLFKISNTDDEDMKDKIDKVVTFSGNFVELSVEGKYLFYGHKTKHPRYGYQYNVENYEISKPKEEDGIVEFLCSELFVGVGKKTAKKIVETLGEKTLDLILENKDNLLMVPGLKQNKIDQIYDILYKHNASHNIIVYLTNLGFTSKDAISIYNKYRDNSINNVENNIYKLINDFDNLTFKLIDSIARRMGYDILSDERIEACIISCIKTITFERGDTYVLLNDIYEYLKIYNIFDKDITLNLINLNRLGMLVIENDKYYIKDMYDAEKNIANTLYYLSNKKEKKIKNFDSLLKELEDDLDITYNKMQEEAIRSALEKNLSVITGGPGTGKTTIIKAIVSLYQKLHKYEIEELTNRIKLLAPTGRAAKRMSEATMLKSSTIHRFLKWNKETDEFMINEYNPDFSEFIIIDEVSMIDVKLFDALLKGLTKNIKIVLVGDYNQLPSVSEGQILKDIIESQVIPVIKLDTLYRQNENSYIVNLAHEINEGELSLEFLKKKDDYAFIECGSINIKNNIIEIVKKAISKGFSYKDMQILAPMYKGENGIDNLNLSLQRVLNPESLEKKQIVYNDIIYRENDKILQLTNMPDNNVYNGDIGIISKIRTSHETSSKKDEIYVDFDGNEVKYEPKDFINIKHGYAISIHKSQGSEFPMIIMPIEKSYIRMLYRKLIYTGVTRAKKSLIIVGNSDAFRYAVANTYDYNRNTSLKDFLIKNV